MSGAFETYLRDKVISGRTTISQVQDIWAINIQRSTFIQLSS